MKPSRSLCERNEWVGKKVVVVAKQHQDKHPGFAEDASSHEFLAAVNKVCRCGIVESCIENDNNSSLDPVSFCWFHCLKAFDPKACTVVCI